MDEKTKKWLPVILSIGFGFIASIIYMFDFNLSIIHIIIIIALSGALLMIIFFIKMFGGDVFSSDKLSTKQCLRGIEEWWYEMTGNDLSWENSRCSWSSIDGEDLFGAVLYRGQGKRALLPLAIVWDPKMEEPAAFSEKPDAREIEDPFTLYRKQTNKKRLSELRMSTQQGTPQVQINSPYSFDKKKGDSSDDEKEKR